MRMITMAKNNNINKNVHQSNDHHSSYVCANYTLKSTRLGLYQNHCLDRNCIFSVHMYYVCGVYIYIYMYT